MYVYVVCMRVQLPLAAHEELAREGEGGGERGDFVRVLLLLLMMLLLMLAV